MEVRFSTRQRLRADGHARVGLHGRHHGAAAGGRDPGEGRPEPARLHDLLRHRRARRARRRSPPARRRRRRAPTPKGAWRVVARLPEGRVRATVTATDAAGNATVRRRGLTVDTTAPDLALSDPAPGAQITETDAPTVYGDAAEGRPARPHVHRRRQRHARVHGEGRRRASPRRTWRRATATSPRPPSRSGRRPPLRDGGRHPPAGPQHDRGEGEGPRRQRQQGHPRGGRGQHRRVRRRPTSAAARAART